MGRIRNIVGASAGGLAPYCAKYLREKQGQTLIITPTPVRAARIASDLSFFSAARVLQLPEFELSDLRYEAQSTAQLAQRIRALSALASGEPCVVIAPALGALPKYPPLSGFLANAFELAVGASVERADLLEALVSLGYVREEVCEAAGQFAVRGDIVDVFSMEQDYPFRIEFFDIEVDSIRRFDPLTQRSIDNLQRVRLVPAKLDEGVSPLWEYLRAPAGIFIDDPSRIGEVLQPYGQTPGVSFAVSDPAAASAFCDVCYCTPFAQEISGVRAEDTERFETRQPLSFGGHMDQMAAEIRRCLAKDYRVTLVCGDAEKLANLKGFLEGEGLAGRVELRDGTLSAGIELPQSRELYLSETEIFPYRKRRRSRKAKGREIKAFTDIQKGDFVVHETHGIGRFVGVEKKTVLGSTRDYLRVAYAGGDTLFVPVDQMQLIQKYVGADSITPKLNHLTGGEWQRTKERVKAQIRDMAGELLELSAKRAAQKGHAFGPDTTWQAEFEAAFPYEETGDQLRCIEEIKRDMQSERSMDRLLCGDVGYGKTEVAARAVFKCVEDGKQAAILVPTTILAKQHYETFLDRFKDFPFKVEMLSRFRTEKQQEQIVEDLAAGRIDIIIGTHRLVSQDVRFKDLGLLIIDEEQRFGVEHKERIKQLKTNVDVLALSATPIPRTLHMSLTGIRDISVIDEPPEDRLPVQTYVMEEDDLFLADAIKRELARDGQVFVVYNRIGGIAALGRRLAALLPDVKIAIAHGQLPERQLEDVMIDFLEKRTQILLSTAIVESGLDIPNANTIIVMNADRLGLSQLYQLRGRVGRSDRLAYAYFVYKKNKVLSELAEKRLRAIREFTEFGAGFQIAMRDLEIRGAGNLLGVEQSGTMFEVGYELYCKLVDEAVRELTGEAPEGPRSLTDAAVELSLEAYLPEYYVSDELTRIDLYKRIAQIRSEEDRGELADELIDRFGDLPKAAENLLGISLAHYEASVLGIERVAAQQSKLVFSWPAGSEFSHEALGALLDHYGPRVMIYGGRQPRLSVSLKNLPALQETLEVLRRMAV